MSLKPLFVIIFFTSTLRGIDSYEIMCEYKTNTDWWPINDVYYCDQAVDVVDASEEVLDHIEGDHSEGFNHSDVKGFRSYGKKLEVFPRGIEKFFNNMEFLAIWTTGLKEVHREDLAPLTKLRVMSIWENDIEYLEKDLLKTNTELEYIGFGKNRIKHVDGELFNHLKKLHTLHFFNNPCLSGQCADDPVKVWDFVKEVYENCESDEMEEY